MPIRMPKRLSIRILNTGSGVLAICFYLNTLNGHSRWALLIGDKLIGDFDNLLT